ncbi:MAG: aspartate kinase, partial [Flavobacteriaceae bacterium]|nr:aspartate kinase [Flavobacteriaceae bacterium]
SFYKELRDKLKENNRFYLYETNVGAALPVIDTIKKLHDTGEKIQKIRGVFSGSLSYIFNTYSETNLSFSEVLTEASTLGLTEPDAREDLCGNDVARKLLILARELNIEKELKDVSVESLVPKHLNGNTSLAHFNDRLLELNKPLQKRKQVLKDEEVLRYVGELNVSSETLEVKLISENKKTSLGQLKGADSVIEIYSESYGDLPLVIQGAGAGKEVTARGVFSDILKLSNQLN